MSIKLVVFDMAGTVVDEDNVVYKTLREVINEDGYDFTLDKVLEVGAGKEKLQATRDILSLEPDRFSEEDATRIFGNFVPRLAHAYDKLAVKQQPGAEQLFSDLRKNNILIALNTGYNRETAQSLLVKLGWQEGNQIDALITATDTTRNRPFPDMIDLAMKRLGIINPDEVAKVGDSVIDIEEGRNAGCRFCIGVTTGAHTRSQLQAASPDSIVDHLGEVLEIVASSK